MSYIFACITLLICGFVIYAVIGFGRMAIQERSLFLAAMALLIFVLLSLQSTLPISIYGESLQRTITLVKRDWRCTASHTGTTVVMQRNGNATFPQIVADEVCDRYELRK